MQYWRLSETEALRHGTSRLAVVCDSWRLSMTIGTAVNYNRRNRQAPGPPVLAEPKFKVRLAETGELIFVNSPAQFRKFIVEDIKKWAKIIPMPNIKPAKIGAISLLD